jgi:hypothetical protein
MNISQLESYNLGDAVKFHTKLNPELWDRREHLHPEVRDQLLKIADDFATFLGVDNIDIEDITVSGSNAAYTYTKHSDIDLHLVVRRPEDPVYRELFDSKKHIYNKDHDIEIHGIPVELYVQDYDQPAVSQGIYSVLNSDWLEVPRRQRAIIDDVSVRGRYESLQRQIKEAIDTNDSRQIDRLFKKLKRMRQTGLDQNGEFGPENLAYKMLRSQGYIDRLATARSKARSQELSLDELASQPVRYGYGRDSVNNAFKQYNQVSENKGTHYNLEQFKLFVNNFSKDFKLPVIVNNKNILEHTSTTDLFISEYNSVLKKKIARYVWDLPEKLKKYNLTTEDLYKTSTPYDQIVRYTLTKELPGNRIKLKESIDNVAGIIKKLTSLLGLSTQPPIVGDKVDIVDLTVYTMSDRIEIASASNEVITRINNNLYLTASGEIGYLGKHPGAEGVVTTTYFAPANTIETNKTILSLKSKHNNDGLELDGWKINYSNDSITKKLSHMFKEYANKQLDEVGISPDGTNPTTSQFTNEAESDPTDTIREFVEFCRDYLSIESNIKLSVKTDPTWSQKNSTFGRYNPDTNVLEVSLPGRHIMDTFRTIAHELTHLRQHELSAAPEGAGDTGSEWENQANAMAGIIMREWGRSHPAMFTVKESWRFKPCSLSSVELSTVLQKSYRSLSEQTGNRWYPHRCSHLAQYVIKSQKNLIKENAQLNTLGKFQSSLQRFDCRNQVDLQVGSLVAIIQVIPHTSDSVIELNGFTSPKKIKQVFREDNNDIKWLEFTDGSTYPDQHFIEAGKGGGELEGTNTLFFPDKLAAEKTVMSIQLTAPEGWKLSTTNILESSLNEASGYIPTAAEANDPRFSMALTQDVRPGATGRAANALKLNTDKQGHPQIARTNGLVSRLQEEFKRFQK